MKNVSVMYDESKPDQVVVGGSGDPWEDAALLLEGVGVCVQICRNNGISEHNGQPLNEYIKSYIDHVCADYKNSQRETH